MCFVDAGMLTLLAATEETVQRFMQPGVVSRTIRISTVDGVNWTRSQFSRADINRLAIIPGLQVEPENGHDSYVERMAPISCSKPSRRARTSSSPSSEVS